MAMMFGRFEILSELSKSASGAVYKATDTESHQTVALKTLRLDPLGEGTAAFVEKLLAEGERTRDLSSQNIALLYGGGEIEGQFCAAMEYVQGNSVATMLARKEGFSFWDLLDITRQVCAGLDHAASLGVVHSSLEPAKIMVQWDGLVKILGYGISTMSLIGAASGNGLGELLPYCSPEMVKGEAIDPRSNLFTWGAILYQMVTDRRAFDGEDRAALENQIVNQMPPSPLSLNPKIHTGVSELIMKALAKDPGERFQSARDLAAELEKCKEGSAKSVSAGVKKAASANPAVSPAARAAAARKFVSSVTQAAEPTPSAHAPHTISKPPLDAPREARAAAAAAGVGIEAGSHESFRSDDAQTNSSSVLSAAVAEPETATRMPTMVVDPIMAGSVSDAAAGPSFSDIDELPPLKAAAFTPPTQPETSPEVTEPPLPLAGLHRKQEKPKVQAREVAQKALREIKTVPSRLIFYAILCAVALILVVVVALFLHVRSADDDLTAASRPTAATSQEQAGAPADPQPGDQAVPVPAEENQPDVTVRQFDKRTASSGRRKTLAPAPAPIIPGQAQIDSNPQGAQIQIDGKSDPSWITPFDVTGLSPGQHSVAVSKSGYSAETRAVEIASGGKSFVVLHLSPINALMVVSSTPAGAEVILDGRSTGKVTPAQFAVEKGSHTVLLRKQGYLEETTSADLGPGQNFQFAPALRALGNADEIKTVGKFKKLFGKGGESAAGMSSVTIHTQPKGAQIALNRRLLDRQSPVEIMLGPGNYVLDVTLTGFKPVHKIINVEKGGKVAIDETLERE
jgi:eukaryotic-like serine/threonine-protein kinase